MRVSDLIDVPRMKWKLDGISQWITDEEAQGIDMIHLSRRRPDDRLIWPTTKKGDAQPKMVYRQIMNQQHADRQQAPSSSTTIQPKTWMAVWRGAALPKVKQFLWRSCARTLPVAEALCRRGIPTDPYCQFCGAMESIDHALLRCEWTAAVWFGGLGARWEHQNAPTWVDRIMDLDNLARTNGQDGERMKTLMVSLGWEIWKGRCEAKNQGTQPEPRAILDRGIRLA